MELTQALLSMLACFGLGASLTALVIWLIFIGIPYFKDKKWNKFEKNVVYVVKKNFDRPMNITKEYIKDLIKEVQNEQQD